MDGNRYPIYTIDQSIWIKEIEFYEKSKLNNFSILSLCSCIAKNKHERNIRSRWGGTLQAYTTTETGAEQSKDSERATG